MADEDLANPPEVLHPSANLQSESSEFHRSVKLLSGAARGTAQKLHAIDYLQRSPSVVTELVLEVNALATILSGLEEDLLLEGVLIATDRTSMWTNEHHNNLTRSTEECDDALRALRRAVRIADEGFRVVASWKRPKDYIEHLQLDDGSQALETIVRCSHLVSKTRVIVRHTALSRIEILNNDEIQELLRLTQALQHPELHAIWARKDEPFASRQMQLFILPSRTYPTTQIEASKDETPSTSSPPDQASDSSVKPVLTPDCVLTASQGDTKPGEVTFGEPSVIKPTSSSSLFANLQPNSAFANYSQPQTGLFGPKPPHLEAYLLRPTVQTTESTSVLSYGDEPLRLNEEAKQSQLRNLGPDYSVMDELLNLHPQQLILMQRRAASRHGDIVSVQHGRPVNLETIMGSIQAKPAVYIISTTTALPLEGFGISHPTVFANHTLSAGKSLFGGALVNQPAPVPAPTGLFQNIAPMNNNSAPGPSAQHLFDNFAPETNNYASAPVPLNTSTEHFQTITANKERSGSDESLEEIRLADYKAGRRYAGMGRGLFGGLSGSSERAFPPPFAAGTSDGKWYPKPLNGDDTSFPPYRGRPGFFAGFTVDNSGDTPAFTKSSAWGVPISAITASRSSWPTSGTRSLFGRQEKSLLGDRVEHNPYANDKLHAGNFCTTEHQHGLFCRVPPANAIKTETVSASPFANPPVPSGSRIHASSSTMSPFEALKKSPFGAFGPQPPSCSGGQLSLNPKQDRLATDATTQPKSGSLFDGDLFDGGLFGGGMDQSNRSHLPSTSGNTFFGGAAATSQQPTQTWPQSQSNHCFPTQPGCALFAQPSYPPARPVGLFGSSSASAAIASFNPPGLINRSTQASEPPSGPFGGLFGSPYTTPSASATSTGPAQTIPSSSGLKLSNNVYPAAETTPFATSSKPVQASVIAPGTKWSDDSFAPAISKPNALQEYQRQLREHEERRKEAMRAETLTRRGPHDDAALAELIGFEKPAPSDDKSEKEKEARYKMGLATLFDSKIIDTTGAAEAATSSKERKEEDVSDTATTSEKCDDVDAVASSADADATKYSGVSSKERQLNPSSTSSQYHGPMISSDNEDDFYL